MNRRAALTLSRATPARMMFACRERRSIERMRTSPDPILHRQRERQFMSHVEKLLDDERLRLDTTRGRRPVTAFESSRSRSDRGVDLKRIMSELGMPDRELQGKMPIGETI